METRDHKNSTLIFIGEENHGATVTSPKDEIRERIKIEFYKTYDVMTGIRIAATLGGKFSSVSPFSYFLLLLSLTHPREPKNSNCYHRIINDNKIPFSLN